MTTLIFDPDGVMYSDGRIMEGTMSIKGVFEDKEIVQEDYRKVYNIDNKYVIGVAGNLDLAERAIKYFRKHYFLPEFNFKNRFPCISRILLFDGKYLKEFYLDFSWWNIILPLFTRRFLYKYILRKEIPIEKITRTRVYGPCKATRFISMDDCSVETLFAIVSGLDDSTNKNIFAASLEKEW